MILMRLYPMNFGSGVVVREAVDRRETMIEDIGYYLAARDNREEQP